MVYLDEVVYCQYNDNFDYLTNGEIDEQFRRKFQEDIKSFATIFCSCIVFSVGLPKKSSEMHVLLGFVLLE